MSGAERGLPSHLMILDNQAVRALHEPTHRQHRQVLSHLQVVASRKQRAAAIQVVVPTSVQVEAGWDRTAPGWVLANRLRIADAPLDSASANLAATIRERTGVSVANAHLGAIIWSTPADHITVLSSDPDDMRRVAGVKPVVVVTL